jgi:hypothetical protein
LLWLGKNLHNQRLQEIDHEKADTDKKFGKGELESPANFVPEMVIMFTRNILIIIWRLFFTFVLVPT